MIDHDRDTLTFIGSHFHVLQGLRIVPIGGMLIFWFFLELFWSKNDSLRWIGPASLVAGIVGYILAVIYYRRTFGVVSHKYSSRAVLAVPAFFAAYALCAYADDKQGLISFQMLLWAFIFLWGYFASSRRRKHFVPIAAFLVVCALLPLTGFAAVNRYFTRSLGEGLGNLIVGISFVWSGILDHRLLLRYLPEPARAGDE